MEVTPTKIKHRSQYKFCDLQLLCSERITQLIFLKVAEDCILYFSEVGSADTCTKAWLSRYSSIQILKQLPSVTYY